MMLSALANIYMRLHSNMGAFELACRLKHFIASIETVVMQFALIFMSRCLWSHVCML